MPITNLNVTNLGPFEDIAFEFDRQVNVFTGSNNTGKSSALWALGDIAVYPFRFPEKLLWQGFTNTFHAHIAGEFEFQFDGQLPIHRRIPNDAQGYWNQERWDNYVDVLKTIGYSKFIPALRRSTDFRSPGPTARQGGDTKGELGIQLDDFENLSLDESERLRLIESSRLHTERLSPELRRRLTLVSRNPSLISDESVIQKIIELDYRSYLRREPVAREIIVKIGEMASEITDDFPIEFVGIDEDTNGFFPAFRTVDGQMPLNTLSQGTQSIIQLLAHLLIGYAEYYDFPENLGEKPGIFIIDEIDAHLHPSWQRRIIPTLTRHFPNLQIFCSTHSPLMLTGLREGQIQLLQRDENGKVTVSRNEVDIIGWTADEVIRTVMGVEDPTDNDTAEAARELRQLRGEGPRSDSEEEGARQERMQELRQRVDRDLLAGGPQAAQRELFEQQFAEALQKYRQSQGLIQENG